MIKETITAAIDGLEKAYDGESVRQALIDLLDTLNTVGGNTELLGGYHQDHYVLESELKWLEDVEIGKQFCGNYDTEPNKDSLKVIKNKDITKYFNGIFNNIRKINGDVQGHYSDAPEDKIGINIADALYVLQNDLDEIKQSISRQGVTVYDTDSALDIGKRIGEINKTTIEVVPYTCTEVSKEVPETKDPVTHEVIKAYNPVIVAPELKGYTATVRQNGSATCPAGFDGWKTVIVDVSTSGSGSSGGGSSSGGSGKKSKGAIDDVVYNTSGVDIRENHVTFKASDYGVDAFDSADVRVTDYDFEDKTFKVTFTSEGQQLGEPVEVQMGSPAYYTGETPEYSRTDEFWYFTGWDPVPNCVVEDMTCEAQFAAWNPNAGTPTSTNLTYLNNTWEDIINGGTNNMSDIKILRLTDGTVLRMRKISRSGGSGNHAYNSVWMSMDLVQSPVLPFDRTAWGTYERVEWGQQDNAVRNYLNGDFFDLIPEPLKNHIVPMDLISIIGVLANNEWLFSYEHSGGDDRIWVPSLQEINYLKATDKGDQYLQNFSNGILTPQTTDGYSGEKYTEFFQWFGKSDSLKDQLKSKYAEYDGQHTPDPVTVARQMYPHVKMDFVIDGQTYHDWDVLSMTEKCDNAAFCEPRFDNYRIEHEERGSHFNPWLPESGPYDGFNFLDYQKMNYQTQGILLRDVIPSNDRYGRIAINNRPDMVVANMYGTIGVINSGAQGASAPMLPICFGIGGRQGQ